LKPVPIASLAPQPWKNKGGVTREIAARKDGDHIVWRLSVADVEAPGPFSIFPGASRVLTVIAGAGLRLRHAGGVIDAKPWTPVRFSGETPIDCDLADGPVRDFNLIFDPARVNADVVALEAGSHNVTTIAGAFGLLPLGAPCAVNTIGDVPPDTFLFLEGASPQLTIKPNAAALLVVIE
jgi:hypothetical protein